MRIFPFILWSLTWRKGSCNVLLYPRVIIIFIELCQWYSGAMCYNLICVVIMALFFIGNTSCREWPSSITVLISSGHLLIRSLAPSPRHRTCQLQHSSLATAVTFIIQYLVKIQLSLDPQWILNLYFNLCQDLSPMSFSTPLRWRWNQRFMESQLGRWNRQHYDEIIAMLHIQCLSVVIFPLKLLCCPVIIDIPDRGC